MKTVILWGAARKKGITNKMVNSFKSNLVGDVYEIDCYRKNISPCVDCRGCWKEFKCSINDDMQQIYKKIDEADVVVLATPMYFHSVSGPMKSIIDRFQIYWAGYIRKDRDTYKKKKGAILMCGGAPQFENQFLGGEIVLKGVLGDINANCEGIVTISSTDFLSDEDYLLYDDSIKKLSQSLYNVK